MFFKVNRQFYYQKVSSKKFTRKCQEQIVITSTGMFGIPWLNGL